MFGFSNGKNVELLRVPGKVHLNKDSLLPYFDYYLRNENKNI